MIQVYHTKLNGVWYGAAVQDDQVLVTCFSVEEPDLRRLLRRLPAGIPFQVQLVFFLVLFSKRL